MNKQKRWFLLFILLAQMNITFGQTCDGITLGSQEVIDDFSVSSGGCQHMTGSLTIEGANITNLNGLSGLTQIDGVLQIRNNPTLNGLSGLNNVTSVGGIFFEENDDPDFKNFQGLNALTTVNGSMFIWKNDYLESFSGLENLSGTLKYAKIVENINLADMSAIAGIAEIIGSGSGDGGGFTVKQNKVQNLNGWQNLTKINTFFSVLLEDDLTDISALSSLEEVTGSFAMFNHPLLTNLDGLDNLVSIGGNLTLSNNDALTDCEALCNLLNNGSAASYNVGSNGSLACAIWVDEDGNIVDGDGTLPNICAAMLPVELVSFDAILEGEKVLLDWNTQSEIDNAGFSIQRSLDGKNWVNIGWVEGHGSTTEAWRYEFLDYQPATGIGYYRLAQEDYDGRVSASKVVGILMAGYRLGMTIAPNPASDIVYLQSHSKIAAEINVFSSLGQRMFSGTAKVIDVSNFPKGIYYVVAELDGQIFQEKLMVE